MNQSAKNNLIRRLWLEVLTDVIVTFESCNLVKLKELRLFYSYGIRCMFCNVMLNIRKEVEIKGSMCSKCIIKPLCQIRIIYDLEFNEFWYKNVIGINQLNSKTKLKLKNIADNLKERVLPYMKRKRNFLKPEFIKELNQNLKDILEQ